MRLPALPPPLVTPFHGFAILSGAALPVSLLWPEPTVGRTLFLQVLVFLQGILSLQIGEVERGYGGFRPHARLLRLFFFTATALALALPFLLVHRVETGSDWPAFSLSLLFLLAHGFVWTSAGYGLPAVVRSEGLRFVVKYGGLVLANVLPLFFAPFVSGLWVLPALWEGRGAAAGLALYLGLSGVSIPWIWRGRRGS